LKFDRGEPIPTLGSVAPKLLRRVASRENQVVALAEALRPSNPHLAI
jgi:hypothetical protein